MERTLPLETNTPLLRSSLLTRSVQRTATPAIQFGLPLVASSCEPKASTCGLRKACGASAKFNAGATGCPHAEHMPAAIKLPIRQPHSSR